MLCCLAGRMCLPRAERAVAAQSLGIIEMPLQVQRSETAPWAGSRSCCMFLRLQWQQFHKLDQGRLLFDALRLLFNQQGVPVYTVLGQPVIQ